LKKMGDALDKGMVLVMSLWGDFFAHMLWLESNYPTDGDASKPGVARGTCATDSGDPTKLIDSNPDATVSFSNVRWGPIGSTYSS
jgi:cellulose 1,4-beta-cellobiosidase